jgi:hypothetical protein
MDIVSMLGSELLQTLQIGNRSHREPSASAAIGITEDMEGSAEASAPVERALIGI